MSEMEESTMAVGPTRERTQHSQPAMEMAAKQRPRDRRPGLTGLFQLAWTRRDLVLQKCALYEADERPHISLTCPHSSISIGCTVHVGLAPRPDFCRWEGGGVATLPPVGFPDLTRRDPDLGQGSFCYFWQFCFCVDLDHRCLGFSW